MHDWVSIRLNSHANGVFWRLLGSFLKKDLNSSHQRDNISPRPRATGHFFRNSASAQWVKIYIRKTTFQFPKNFTVLMQAAML